ncbi:MAG: AAA family ATPase [Candidatus Binatia bacterium]
MNPREYLSVALQRLDLLLHREILRLRAHNQLSLDEFRGLYISDEQVNQLVNRAVDYQGASSAIDELTGKAELLRAEAKRQSDASPWQTLVAEFSLSPIEEDALLLAVAPELDLKYETLFGYLNNDITRKWPTFDLALRTSAAADRQPEARRSLLPEARLFGSGLLRPMPSDNRRAWLATGFSAAPAVSHYLWNSFSLDPNLASFVEQRTASLDWQNLSIACDLGNRLLHFASRHVHRSTDLPAVVLVGAQGTGRAQAAEAICRELGVTSLLRVDLDGLRSSGENAGQLTREILLQQRLYGAALYLRGFDALFDTEHRSLSESRAILKLLSWAKGPVFVPCASATPWRELLSPMRTVAFQFDLPDYSTRLRAWKNAAATFGADIATPQLQALADRFTLTSAQIAAAAASATSAGIQPDGATPSSVDAVALFDAARNLSDQSLGNLAVKVRTAHSWEDLVLPRPTLQRVREITNAIRNRQLVYSEWGFKKRIAAGLGIKILFSGASGTGKTMSAGVIAKDLGVDLYKIDLSAIVSKYIGETEKNLDRIFRAAQLSNAIVFFDEADALFGKRSEVKDAHDRYANIEVAYLLQKVEEYEGVVILASNLSKNIDEAFLRRMHYVVEFPLPNETDREQLWRGMFPAAVPLGKDVDFQFLARQFPIAGGEIRNVALEAAFLAAEDGKVVTMRQLATAVARQMKKQGKIPSGTDFKEYHPLILDYL